MAEERKKEVAGQSGFRLSISRKLMSSFLMLSLVPLLIISILSYMNASAALRKETFAALAAVAEAKTDQIEGYFHEKKGQTEIFASTLFVAEAIGELNEVSKQAKAEGYERKQLLEFPAFKAVFDKYHPFMKKYKETYGLHDVFLFSPNSGRILLSVTMEDDFGTELKEGGYDGTLTYHLAKAWREMARTKNLVITDFEPYLISNDEAAMFIVTPAYDKGEYVGGVAIQVPIDQIDHIMQQRAGLGKTGETYLIGSDYLMRSNSRFETQSTILKKKMDTPGVRDVFTLKPTERGPGICKEWIYKDYRGIPVLGHNHYLEGLGWAVMAEIDAAEAFAPVTTLRNWMLLVALAVIIIVTAIARIIALGIVGPLQNTVGKVREIAAAAGDLTKEVEVKSDDELGDLARAFNGMIATLGGFVSRVRSAGLHTVSASAQILAASQQHATGATQQSAQINQITNTMTELAAAAEQVSQSANKVAKISENTVKTAESGSKSILDTTGAMARINDSVKELARTIESLGKKSKKITGILEFLDDITEQTNLLSINAAIEAAKAGETGKGFTVVADEIRKLAENSRKAAKDIGALIEDIQADTQVTVSGMKNNAELVDEGSALAARSGDAIKAIISSMEESSQAIRQIALSAQQQTSGAGQISKTMAGINAVVKQSVAGTEQSIRSAKDLAAMAEQLKSSIGQFKIKEE